MSTTTDTTPTTAAVQASPRTRLRSAMQWLDRYTLWAMNPATTVATRQRLLTEQWSRSVTPDQIARELVR